MTLSLPFSRHRHHKADYPPQVDDETPAEREARLARNILLGLSNDVRLEQAHPNHQTLRLLGHEASVLADSEVVSPFLKAITLSEAAANLVGATEVDSSGRHIATIKALAEAALANLPPASGIVPEDYLAAMHMTNSDRPFREAVEAVEDIRLLRQTQAAEQQARRVTPITSLDATGAIDLGNKK